MDKRITKLEGASFLVFAKRENCRIEGGALPPLLSRYVDGIFGAYIIHNDGWYIKSGQGRKSLGTIEVAEIETLYYGPSFNGHGTDYRTTFSDGRASYRLAVTDLSFRYYTDWLSAQGWSNEMVSEHVKSFLSVARWAKLPSPVDSTT